MSSGIAFYPAASFSGPRSGISACIALSPLGGPHGFFRLVLIKARTRSRIAALCSECAEVVLQAKDLALLPKKEATLQRLPSNAFLKVVYSLSRFL